MGLVNIAQFFNKYTAVMPASLAQTNGREADDIEQIAKSLARQSHAAAEDWPFFVKPAESLMRYNKRLVDCC